MRPLIELVKICARTATEAKAVLNGKTEKRKASTLNVDNAAGRLLAPCTGLQKTVRKTKSKAYGPQNTIKNRGWSTVGIRNTLATAPE